MFEKVSDELILFELNSNNIFDLSNYYVLETHFRFFIICSIKSRLTLTFAKQNIHILMYVYFAMKTIICYDLMFRILVYKSFT